VFLQALERPVLPPARRDWSDRVLRLWEAWRQDPVTGQYGPADIAAAVELADQFEELQPSEQRLRMDGLALTPKGKRDLRWRTGGDVDQEPEPLTPRARAGGDARRRRLLKAVQGGGG